MFVVSIIFYFLTFSFSTLALKDVVFVLDRSGSLDSKDVTDAIEFIHNVTEWLTIGTEDIQVSLVTFSDNVREEFNLGNFTNKTELLSAIDGLRGINAEGGTYTYDALDFVLTSSFNLSSGGRPGTEKAVVVITDGASNDLLRTLNTADRLRTEHGAEIYSIGIGPDPDEDELNGISNDPDSYYSLSVEDFIYLCNLIPAFVPKLDSEVNATLSESCPAFPTPTVSTTATSTETIELTTDQSTSIESCTVITTEPTTTTDTSTVTTTTTAMTTTTSTTEHTTTKPTTTTESSTTTTTEAPPTTTTTKALTTTTIETPTTTTEVPKTTTETPTTTTETPTTTTETPTTTTETPTTTTETPTTTKEPSTPTTTEPSTPTMTEPPTTTTTEPQTTTTTEQSSTTTLSTTTYTTMEDTTETANLKSGRINEDSTSNMGFIKGLVLGLLALLAFLLLLFCIRKKLRCHGCYRIHTQRHRVLTIGREDIQVSLVTFSDNVREEFNLGNFTNKTDLLSAIDGLRGINAEGGTYTYDALDFVLASSFNSSSGGRPGAQKAVVVITDGASNDLLRTLDTADILRTEHGAEIYSIGIGPDPDEDELNGISNDPDSYYSLSVEDFIYLCNLIPALVPKLESEVNATLSESCPAFPTTTVSTTATSTETTELTTDQSISTESSTVTTTEPTTTTDTSTVTTTTTAMTTATSTTKQTTTEPTTTESSSTTTTTTTEALTTTTTETPTTTTEAPTTTTETPTTTTETPTKTTETPTTTKEPSTPTTTEQSTPTTTEQSTPTTTEPPTTTTTEPQTTTTTEESSTTTRRSTITYTTMEDTTETANLKSGRINEDNTSNTGFILGLVLGLLALLGFLLLLFCIRKKIRSQKPRPIDKNCISTQYSEASLRPVDIPRPLSYRRTTTDTNGLLRESSTLSKFDVYV